MGKIHELLSLFDEAEGRVVERAIAEYRSGRPVAIIGDGDDALLALSVEVLSDPVVKAFDVISPGGAKLLLSAARLRRLGLDRHNPGSVFFAKPDFYRADMLSFSIDGKIDAPVAPLSSLDNSALELARISLISPAVYAVNISSTQLDGDVLRVPVSFVDNYRSKQVTSIKMISRAPVPLEGAGETEFVVFRGGEGFRDQVSIIVGKPDFSKPVAVRMHSACLTGDLFGSLKCDCGDQLRGTVQKMAAGEGGILLYLDQEGRGNGISNKIKAYKLQSQGWDTYDADEALGFGLDQRRFDFAAEMLRQLGVSSVRVMTNNPEKIASLQRAGLEVVSDQRAFGRQTEENVRYLASKRDRAGHFIDFDAMVAHSPIL